MYEESEDTEENIINDDISNFNEMGLIPDSTAISNKSNLNSKDNKKGHKDKTLPAKSVKIIPNRLSKHLDDDSIDETEENIDADPEDIISPNSRTKTLDDLWTLHMFGKNDPHDQNLFGSKNAKFFERLLNPMEYGTIRGSIFGLSSLCLEAGSLVLGNRCRQFGLANFIITLILGGLLAYWCLVMMIKAGKNLKEKSYSKVVKAILGEKVGIFMDIIIAIDLFGELISFQVIIYQTLGAIIYDILNIAGKLDTKTYDTFVDYRDKYWKEKAYLKYPIMFGSAVLLFPLCLLKDLSKMRIPSLIGVLALIYSILVVLIESFFYIINDNRDKISKMNWIDITQAFNVKEGIPFFGGVTTVFYLYSCHAGAYPVYRTLKNNTTKRIKTVFWRSILLDVLVYIFIATASFLTSPINSPDLILYRKNLKDFDPDYFILIAKIGLLFNTFFNTPANYEVFRLSFFELVWGNSVITDKKNILVTGVVLVLVTIIGAVYDKIVDYFELIGGFCTVVYCIFIPGLIYALNNNIQKSKLEKNLIIGLFVFLTLFGYTSVILTIVFKVILHIDE